MSAAPPPGQFEVVLSDGLRIERLPVGFGAGHVWVSFVLSGIDFFHEEDGVPIGWGRRQLFDFDGPDGPVVVLGRGGGGGDTTQHQHFEFDATGLSRLRVNYLDDGASVATETIDLT